MTGCQPDEALPGVRALVDQSLVALDHARREPRYDTLDVVRRFAVVRLADAGECTEALRRDRELGDGVRPATMDAGLAAWR